MPYSFRRRTRYTGRRTYYTKRKYPGRRRFRVRRTRYTRRPRRVNWYRRKYNFKAKWQSNHFGLAPPTMSPLISFGLELQAAYLPNWATMHTLYDQYKIYKWKITILPPAGTSVNAYQETTGLNQRGLSTCRHYLAYDFTDATPPPNAASMIACSNTKSAPWNRPLKMIIRPRLLKAAYEIGVTSGSGYAPGTSWVDVDDQQVPHYGFKYYMDNTQYAVGETHNAPVLDYKIMYTVYYGFKNINKPGLS